VRASLVLFARLIVRPMLREKLRTALTILAVALGVAVVLAIELAGRAAVGSFQASVESLAGDTDLEVVAVGGVPEEVVGRLATLPYPMRVVPRMEEQVRVIGTYRAATLLGVDAIASGSGLGAGAAIDGAGQPEPVAGEANAWVTAAVGARPGDRLSLLVSAGTATLTVRASSEATKAGPPSSWWTSTRRSKSFAAAAAWTESSWTCRASRRWTSGGLALPRRCRRACRSGPAAREPKRTGRCLRRSGGTSVS